MTEAAVVRKAPLRYAEIQFERYQNPQQLDGFHCRERELNDFILNDDEVGYYERENLGRTYLVRHRQTWEVVAFYTVAPHSIRCNYARRTPNYRPEPRIEEFPSLMIGRLAVQEHWEGRGIGSLLLSHIALEAVSNEHLPFRLLVLTAKQDSIPFYERYGFVLSSKHGNENRREPVMIYDLAAFRDAIGTEPPRLARAGADSRRMSLH